MKIHLPYLIIIAFLIYLLATCNKGKPDDDGTKEQLKTAIEAKKRAEDSVTLLQGQIADLHEKDLQAVTAYDDLMLQFLDLKDEKVRADKNVTALINEFANAKDTIQKLIACNELAKAAQLAKEACDKAIKNKDDALNVQTNRLMLKGTENDLLARQVRNLQGALDTCGKGLQAAQKAIVQCRYFSLGGEVGGLMPGNGFAMGVIEYHTVNGYHLSGAFGSQINGEKVGAVRVTKDLFKIKKR